jgi:hypothetical protein
MNEPRGLGGFYRRPGQVAPPRDQASPWEALNHRSRPMSPRTSGWCEAKLLVVAVRCEMDG